MYYNKLNIYSYIVFIIIVLSFIVLFSLKKKLNDRKVRANLPDLPNAFDYSNKLDIKRHSFPSGELGKFLYLSIKLPVVIASPRIASV